MARSSACAGAPLLGAVERVPITRLRPADSPRLGGVDREHTSRLAEVEEPLPPILVHRATGRVIDGMHRLRAAILRGESEIAVVYFDGDEADAFLRAVKANTEHGLPLSRADRRAAAARIVASHPQLSDRAIAAHTGLSAKTVAAVRRSSASIPQSNARVGADGRTRPLNSARGRMLAAEAIAQSPDTPLREIARAAGISLSTAHDVRRRVAARQDPVPGRYTAAVPGPARPPVPRPAATPVPRPAATRVSRPATASAAGRHEPVLDRAGALQKLRRDPVLRHTAPGREVLAVLQALSGVTADCAGRLESVPAHCAETVAALVRACALSLCQLADELEHG